uniref:Calcyclin-binding protein n=1 Tax=Salmo salar TaxID=8030 RepID=B9EN29_SALSA|nr:Calcyclin-binding protein [Salmo salar]
MEALQKDIEELQSLNSSATRVNVKLFLGAKIEELQSKLVDLKDERTVEALDKDSRDNFFKPIKNYSWDQNDTYIKIYVSTEGLSEENVKVDFEKKSMDLKIINLNGPNYHLSLPTLLRPVSTKDCSFKVKNSMLYVLLKKVEKSKWECLSVHEKTSQPKVDPPKPSDNPTDGLMNMVKKMYDEGDDETKRMLNKAMSEAYAKKDQMPPM